MQSTTNLPQTRPVSTTRRPASTFSRPLSSATRPETFAPPRARTAALEDEFSPLDSRTWICRSATVGESGRRNCYALDVWGGRVTECEYRGFENRGSCRHMRKLQMLLDAREAETKVPTVAELEAAGEEMGRAGMAYEIAQTRAALGLSDAEDVDAAYETMQGKRAAASTLLRRFEECQRARQERGQ